MLKKYTFCFAVSALLLFSAPIRHIHAGDAVDGTVLETMNAAGYTYIQVDSGTEKEWVAIPETEVAVGDHVSYRPGMAMKDFHSKSLDRTFPSIIFSPGLVGEAQAAAEPAAAPAANESFAAAVAQEQQAPGGEAPAAMAENSGGSTGAIVPFAEASVEKAPGNNSFTVGELFSRAAELQGQTVRLRGKVMKFSANIMGRNWVHLQDGSGDPMNNTHDLVVTTKETVAKGDVVIMEGTLAADKDFGAGYKYAAIVEEAQVIN